MPSATEVRRRLPKEAFYRSLKLTPKQKNAFVHGVERTEVLNSIKYRARVYGDGDYLRIIDMTRTGRRSYLDINGNDANNYTNTRGKRRGRNQSEYYAATHFRILKTRDM